MNSCPITISWSGESKMASWMLPSGSMRALGKGNEMGTYDRVGGRGIKRVAK